VVAMNAEGSAMNMECVHVNKWKENNGNK